MAFVVKNVHVIKLLGQN